MKKEDGYYFNKAKEYAENVCSGKKIAGKLTILACKRFLDDLYKEHLDTFKFRFSIAKAERACQFMEFLPHIKGALASKGELLKLEPWQCFIVCNIFGWVSKETGKRRFKKAYVEVARKNGKTFLASGIALYCGVADQEEGAEVYIGASTHSQALICFNEAKAMISKDQEMCDYYGIEYNKLNIFIPCTNSLIKALPRDNKGTLDGLNIHCAIIDELHAHQTSDTYNAIITGTGAREQPIVVSITTAGVNRTAICYEQRSYVKKMLEGYYQDDSYFGIIYTIDENDDWRDEKVWEKANPNLGVSINFENFKAECKQAENQISKQNSFLTKHMNVWVGSHVAWMDMNIWESCKDETLTEEDCKNMELFIAADLSSVSDFCSVAKLYTFKKKNEKDEEETHYRLFCNHYLNENAVENSKIEEVKIWSEQGFIKKNSGNATDFKIIQNDIEELAIKKPIMIGFDKYQAEYMMQDLISKGVKNIVAYPQNVGTMSAPMKEFEASILTGRLKHNGDPVLTWMIGNVIARLDAKDNIYPNRDKNARHQKIDGAVASIMAFGMSMKERPKPLRVKLYF